MSCPAHKCTSVPTEQASWNSLLAELCVFAVRAGVFGTGDKPVRVEGAVLRCPAMNAPSEAAAEYRVSADQGRVYVSLVTSDRYLSQSIEQDLVHSGDKIGELLNEELIDLGASDPTSRNEPLPVVEHFRSPEKMYTFRTPMDSCKPRDIMTMLRAYEACFRELGDMNAGDDDE